MIHQFQIHFKNKTFKMEELPSHWGGCYLQKKVGGGDIGGHIPHSD